MPKSKTAKKLTKPAAKVAKAKPKGAPIKKPKTKIVVPPTEVEITATVDSITETEPVESNPPPKPADECPRGGGHEWQEEDGDRFCRKCKEPAPTIPAEPLSVQAAPESKVKKLSAIDAAAKLLAETGEPLNCQQLIEQIAAKGYWTSPGGKTPSATLYSSIIREIKLKGASSRFVKTERGKFAPAAVS